MSESSPAAVPLDELLRRIPRDARYTYTETDGLKATHFIPIGRHAHEAAEAMMSLRAEVSRLTAELEAARKDAQRYNALFIEEFPALDARGISLQRFSVDEPFDKAWFDAAIDAAMKEGA